jgi:hypothetical protein
VISHNENALSLLVKEEAQRLGFELVGISAGKTSAPEESSQTGCGGASRQLEYMKRMRSYAAIPNGSFLGSVHRIGRMNYYTPFRPAASPEPKAGFPVTPGR